MDIKKKIMANCFQPEDIERARTIERELQQNFEIDKLIEEAEGTSFADPMLQLREAFEKLDTLFEKAVTTDGEHHKQWYLEEIAKVLAIELPEHEKGIPP
jgi:hypothetical protein